jgi:hypothetical protein
MSPVQDSQSVQEINAGFDAVMAVVKKYEALAPFFYRGAIENEVASADGRKAILEIVTAVRDAIDASRASVKK